MHDELPQKLIQKNYTFETNFIGTIFNYRKIIKELKKGDYNLVGVETKWFIRRPFHVTVIAIIRQIKDIDLVEIRKNRSKTFLDEQTGKLEKGDV
jgi:hypothetical protein